MKPSLMRTGLISLSRQKKESFKLKTGLLKLASLRINMENGQSLRHSGYGYLIHMQDGSPQEGRKGQRGYMKN